MSSTLKTFDIAVFSGDGIGPEITPPCLELLNAACEKADGVKLNFTDVPAGAALYRDTGESFPATSKKVAKEADAILLSCMGLPAVRYPDGTEVSPQIDLRMELGLYAGVRPVRLVPGLDLPLASEKAKDIDLVLIRESTEGLFASHGKGTVENDSVAKDTMVITRAVSERLFDFAFKLASHRKQNGSEGKVTCVDKANVFQSFAFFRKVFDEQAALNTNITADHSYVDAMALNLVRHPWHFDVLVTENMFGDILSDLGAALMGGMGMAPSADIGNEHAVFQPCHGSAPDIVGEGKANPTAMFLSSAMMLDWLDQTHNLPACSTAANFIREAVDNAFIAGDLIPYELGGSAGTDAITTAVMAQLQK
ncbi:isocitrate/isopropylmalate dehydrogenase family protein [Marinomonas sp. 2405UD68-3]|uniref:isocitrate/isopropylmalate dehydrogenase family protein n=1 Tax=Marinomonas sp. 2405UD68-3 TaxID=3391835 RepID=UPI0039C8E634